MGWGGEGGVAVAEVENVGQRPDAVARHCDAAIARAGTVVSSLAEGDMGEALLVTVTRRKWGSAIVLSMGTVVEGGCRRTRGRGQLFGMMLKGRQPGRPRLSNP